MPQVGMPNSISVRRFETVPFNSGKIISWYALASSTWKRRKSKVKRVVQLLELLELLDFSVKESKQKQ